MFDVFLSYSHFEQEDARKLHTLLWNAGYRTWIDKVNLRSGDHWRDEISKIIFEAKYIVVLLTPNTIASEDVEFEWKRALELGKRVISILLKPCTVPDLLSEFHYHIASTDEGYHEMLIKLGRDLANFELQDEKQKVGIAGNNILPSLEQITWNDARFQAEAERASEIHIMSISNCEALKTYKSADSDYKDWVLQIKLALSKCRNLMLIEGKTGTCEVKLLDLIPPFSMVAGLGRQNNSILLVRFRSYKFNFFTQRPSVIFDEREHTHWFNFYTEQFHSAWVDADKTWSQDDIQQLISL